MIDLWNRLRMIFAIPETLYPEIEIVDLNQSDTRFVADYIVRHLRGVSTQFHTFESEDRALIRSAEEVVDGVARGTLIGALGGELRVARYVLPEMLFVFEEPGFMIVSYSTGLHWTPLTIIALFEFFRIVKKRNPHAEINLSDIYFNQDWINNFQYLLRMYLHDTK